MNRQGRFTFQEALKQLQIVSDDVNNDSDAEATSSSETESIVDDDEVPLKEELSGIDVFEEENEDAGSDEYQEPNDNDGSSEDETQVAIIAGNATYCNNLFQAGSEVEIYWHKNLELLLLPNMKWMLSKYFTNLKLYFR